MVVRIHQMHLCAMRLWCFHGRLHQSGAYGGCFFSAVSDNCSNEFMHLIIISES
jgi:hypothetical protein